MPHTLADIAAATGLDAEGDTALAVARPAEPAVAGPDDLALAMSPKYAKALGEGRARAAVLWPGADWRALGLEAALYAPRARLALAHVTGFFAPALDMEPGVHPTALVHPGAAVGEDAWIGPYAVIGAGSVLGAGVRIGAHVTVGSDVRVGPETVIQPGARLARGIQIGARGLIGANACLGGDGFSYVTPERGAVESAKTSGRVAEDARNTGFRRIASLGRVVIGDDVEVGAGTCIDRGTVADTTVGDGTKIDNQVMLGHNVRIGRTCLVCGQVGLAGSVTVGDRTVLGGQVGVADHVAIGHDCVLAGGTLVGQDIRAGSVMMGVPATDRQSLVEQMMALKRLPRLLVQMREVRAKLGI
ncbi:MAG: UDP-3-O-(3-hydroxymyristoyl)glucosamine N-acyltransferase [Pseudomonadota bacterium]